MTSNDADREPRPGDFWESPDLGKRVSQSVYAQVKRFCVSRTMRHAITAHSKTAPDLRTLSKGTRYDQ